MKKLVREFEFTPEQREKTLALARAFSLTETTAGILFARGIDTAEKMKVFLSPSERNYLSPFLMKGMKEAAATLATARDEGWRVAVFGDYDADGIGALAIMDRALKTFGIEPYLFAPERSDGYGLSKAALDRIFDEFLPDLIVTVDCGISCRDEVEYIKEQGAFCIVTDHHELPDVLPDCVVINPKLDDDYPYDNLCGAGVAFKLAQALIGERAYPLADFAALSTVADSVPLLGENRDIVAAGLKKIANDPRPCFSALLGKAEEVTAQTLAFTLAPRINAAGRMGDSAAALRLFTSEDEDEIAELAARLNRYNAERQKYCDELYTRAQADVAREGDYQSVLMLSGENWNAGFVGIVAARLAEEYTRPALLFVKRGEFLKGSARSIESVNIFEALKNCSDFIEEFGGHAQAAGINVRAENFEALRNALDAYISSRYTREDFEPTVTVAGEGTENFAAVARELTLLEPCGMGNRRPCFAVRAGKVQVSPIKPNSPHLSMNIGGLDFVYFNGLKDLAVLESDVEKEIVFEYNLSRFRGKEYVKGFVRCVTYDGSTGKEVELEALESRLRLLKTERAAEELSEEGICALLEEKLSSCAYGLCAVCYDRAALSRFPALAGMRPEVFRPSSASSSNVVLYAPDPACDLSAFREVVCLDGPCALPQTGRAKIYSNARIADTGAMKHLSCSREELLSLFARLKEKAGARVSSYAHAARSLHLPGVPPEQVVFALAVFEELGLVSLEGGRLGFIRKHTELGKSAIYRAVSRVKEER